MPTKQKTRTRMSRAEWAEHLSVWQRSGLTQNEYCAQHHLSVTSFSGWKTKLGQDAENSPLVELAPARQFMPEYGDGEHIELFLEGMIIRLRESIDPMRLRNIIIALSVGR